MPKRPSIADNSDFAAATPTTTTAATTATPATAPATAHDSTPAKKAAKKADQPARTNSRRTGVETTNVSIALRATTLDEARRAYYTDSQHGGTAVNFSAWISDALRTWARLSPTTRNTRTTKLNTTHPETTTEKPSPRRYQLDAPAVEAAYTAIDADHDAGNPHTSMSAWCLQAIRQATQHVKDTHGDLLTIPHNRLPVGGARPRTP